MQSRERSGVIDAGRAGTMASRQRRSRHFTPAGTVGPRTRGPSLLQFQQNRLVIRGLGLLIDLDRQHTLRQIFRNEYEIAVQLRLARYLFFVDLEGRGMRLATMRNVPGVAQ